MSVTTNLARTAQRHISEAARIVLMMVLVLGFAAAAIAQTERGAGQQEGIRVHGRWTIEVREQDGTLVKRHEFNNALDGINGQRVLAGLLGRFYKQIAQWQIRLDTAQLGVCVAGVLGCIIDEHLGTGEPPLGRLKVNIPTFVVGGGAVIPSAGTIELAGSAQFVTPGVIRSVESQLYICPDASCAPPGRHFYPFTIRTLPTPINVAATQIVQVTVVLSFS